MGGDGQVVGWVYGMGCGLRCGLGVRVGLWAGLLVGVWAALLVGLWAWLWSGFDWFGLGCVGLDSLSPLWHMFYFGNSLQ